MQFEGLTPQEAANAIVEEIERDVVFDDVAAEEARFAIAESNQHFYERGQASMRPKYGPAAPGEGVAAMKPADAFYTGWLAAEDNHIDPQDDVRQFMAAFKQALPVIPQWPDQATMDLRVRMESEEYVERMEALGYGVSVFVNRLDPNEMVQAIFRAVVPPQTARKDFAESADGAIDQMYVLIGSLLAMGIDMWPLWAEVQRANMAKAGGPVVNGKQLKPEGWQPPDIAGLLKAQGWEDADNAVS